MYLVPLKEPFFEPGLLRLGKKKVGTINGILVIKREEIETLVEVCQFIWKRLLEKAQLQKFVGLVRFDLIPNFSLSQIEITQWRRKEAFDLGSLEIGGVYEVNAHSPECAAGVSCLHWKYPLLGQYQPNVAQRISKAIMRTFGAEEILFFPGEGLVKKAWRRVFLKDLHGSGLRLREVSWQTLRNTIKITSNSPIIWRWGDARLGGPSEYPQEVIDFLLNYPGEIFNSLPQVDIANKKFLVPDGSPRWDRLVGENIILSGSMSMASSVVSVVLVSKIIEQKDKYLLKPLSGSSGSGILFGRMLSHREWEKKVLKIAFGGGYQLCKARWLPCIETPLGNFVLDINPAFWVHNENMQYLYTVARVDQWENYWKRGVINVTQGAGYAGALVEDLYL